MEKKTLAEIVDHETKLLKDTLETMKKLNEMLQEEVKLLEQTIQSIKKDIKIQ